jgi:SAM-dependent methyltransferase
MTSAPGAPFQTFRDPAGSLSITGEEVIRQVRPAYADSAREFLASKMRHKWEAAGDMVATEVITDTADGLTLRHPRLWFATYPWEWTLGQWRAAAELTLNLQQDALAAGWILKDATPLNILFNGTKPQLVDVLSFERRDPKSPLWLAYAQFVRTFLLPLIAHRWLDWPLSATSSRRDGFEPHEIFHALPRLRRYRPELLWPVTLPVMLEKKSDNPEATRKARQTQRDPEIATLVLKKSAAGLLKQVRRAAPPPEKSAWSQYEMTAQHYTAAEIEQKRTFVDDALRAAQPQSVLDIGANTGTYSLLAAKYGARVLALEGDASAAERIWQRALETHADVLPVIANLAWPTPGYGWENAETHALLERMANKFDFVLMLAVVHHLLLHEQIPLPNIARLIARLCRHTLLLEWVPVSDPMFQKLLRGREHIYGALTEQDWERAAAPYFDQLSRQALGNGRVMLLYRKK